jgi:aminoglycoside phosphotransferase (APT) family kinase protein
MSVADPKLAGIDPPRVREWLAANVPGLVPPVEFTLVAGGRSNLTYRVRDAAGRSYALRRPPTGGVLSTAHDMHREWRFLSALASTEVPVPTPLAFCADPDLTGGQFYVMDFVDGLVLADEQAGAQLAGPARAVAGAQVVDVLVGLHRVEPAEVGLADIARPDGYVQRQLRRWHRQAHQSGADYLGLIDEVHGLLGAGTPEQGGGIVHGDYRPGNMSFAPDGRVLAIFDWELATSGEPLADLGWLVSTWAEPGDVTPATTQGPSAVPGYPSRADLVERYATASGRDVSALPYYVAFSQWRAACIMAGVAARYRAGVMGGDGYAEEARLRGEQAEQLVEAARDSLRAR